MKKMYSKKKMLKEHDPSMIIPDIVKATFNLLSEGVVVLDEEGYILLANISFINSLSQTELNLVGKKLAMLDWQDPRTGELPKDLPWQQSMRSHQKCNGTILNLYTNNTISAFIVNSSPMLNISENVSGIIVTFGEVSGLTDTLDIPNPLQAALQRENQELFVETLYDPLTGSLNKKAFIDKFEEAFKSLGQQKTELSCIMLDIDHFKTIKDKYGSQKSDEVIKNIAAILDASIRGKDVVGYLGDGEFCIFLQFTSLGKAAQLAERLRSKIVETPYTGFKVTSSFGVSSISCGATSIRELINQADEMLDNAKEKGRNCVYSCTLEEQISTIDNNEVMGLEGGARINNSTNARERLTRDIRESVSCVIKENTIGALVLLGLDRFGRINETLGHTIGDAVLKEISRRLTDSFRDTDIVISVQSDSLDAVVSHITADEFAIVLTDIDDIGIISHIVDRTRELVAKTIAIEGNEIHVTSSIGVSIFPDDSNDSVVLLKNATVALKQAKGSGGNTHQFYNSEMDKGASLRLQLEGDLYRAFEQDEFMLYFQPKVDINTGLITGFEALIRWDHPDIGLVSPGLFIPIAEENGLIEPLGSWVLKKSIQQVKLWRDMGYSDLVVAYNLAARQLQNDNIFEEVTSILKECNGEPEWIEIEVTETGLMTDMDKAAKVIKEFRDYGFSIAIDDFGTGYSSLNYIKQFSLNTLKVDRSFVKDLETSSQDRYIITAIVELARTMELKVVAEGVETKHQLEFLKSAGCDEMQGFLFSPPVPADTATEILSLNRKNKIE
jgi:diguanylate cyclase (GGDEF)-like protein